MNSLFPQIGIGLANPLIIEFSAVCLRLSSQGSNAALTVRRTVQLVILATGYYPPQELVRRLLGNDIAERVGRIWGIDEDREMANLWKRTAQRGLWFHADSLPQNRTYSRYLALLIKADE